VRFLIFRDKGILKRGESPRTGRMKILDFFRWFSSLLFFSDGCFVRFYGGDAEIEHEGNLSVAKVLLHLRKNIVFAGTEVHNEIEVCFFGFMNVRILGCKLIFGGKKYEDN